MFTGLVEAVGRVLSITAESGGVTRVTVQAPGLKRPILRGDSVCVSGVCLTAVDIQSDVFSAQVMGETMRVSKLGKMRAGDAVNIEMSLRPEDGLDGHIVLGHVDEVGRVTKVERMGSTSKIWVSASDGVLWGIAGKGSIALDGVSLTVIDSFNDEFSVGVIPATLAGTTLGLLDAGDGVNVEIDIIARYAARLLRYKTGTVQPGGDEASGGSLTLEKLARYGWY
ncbi:MAG: riboflavin synthase [Synergistaceae bacterium]|nr:riboflavin synthase [Synergistaceae bacterium]